MSNKFSDPWTTSEKVTLLLNVLQGQHPDLLWYLCSLVERQGIIPKWDEVALPEGRSLQACRSVFESLFQNPRPVQHQVPSFGGYGPPAFVSGAPYGRSFTEFGQHQPPPRAIQPRPSRSTDSPIPPTTNGESLTIFRAIGSDLGAERPKKRGRPTKEEAEERDRLLAAEGKVHEPKRRPAKKYRASTGTAMSLSETKMSTSPVLQTPLPQTIEAKEDSSSGKRRSRRQENLPSSPTTRSGNQNPVDSPSDRLLARNIERETERPLFTDPAQDQPVEGPAT